MITAIAAIVSALAVLILMLTILLTVVVVGIRRESPHAELSHRAPSRISYVVRRLLGVYVRRSEDADNTDHEACLAESGSERR